MFASNSDSGAWVRACTSQPIAQTIRSVSAPMGSALPAGSHVSGYASTSVQTV